MNNVIILIPHFNNFSGLCTSVFSIEKDEKVDVLIVDDGSFESTINETQSSCSRKRTKRKLMSIFSHDFFASFFSFFSASLRSCSTDAFVID